MHRFGPVGAALNILQRLKAAGPDLEAKHGSCPQLRIGLNTGTAVVGKVEEGADAGVTVLGDAVNFAARLQSLAEPNAVFIQRGDAPFGAGLCGTTASRASTPSRAKLNRKRSTASTESGRVLVPSQVAVSRGLTTFVGRECELEVLELALDTARSQLRVIDLVADPGMGKSRLLHEFRQRINKERAFILSGSCSPDGQQTPFLPFIEVVRGAFRVGKGEGGGEKDIRQKLEMGLTTLDLHSARNLGLLLHLLGLTVPDRRIDGLDGALIGLRTRSFCTNY